MADCRHWVDTGWRNAPRNCRRPAVKDGYCTRHHPDYMSPSAKAALDELEREEADPEYRAQKWLDEAKAHREECARELSKAQDALVEADRAVAVAGQRLAAIAKAKQ